MEQQTAKKIEVSKEFDASVDQLYKAWIEEEALKAWWHPMGNELTNVENEVKEGGKITYDFANTEGQHAFTIKGNYKEVQPGQQLVYTWNWEVASDAVGNSDYLLHIHFSEAGEGRSRLGVTQEGLKEDEAVQPHQQGWEEALNSLEQYLKKT